MRYVLDIETTSDASRIWMVVTQDLDTGEQLCHTGPSTLAPLLDQADLVIGHNLIGFDAPVLKTLWNLVIPSGKIRDTLVLSRLYRPDLEGGHSLENWGRILKSPKLDYTEFDDPDLVEMERYCRQDVTLTAKVWAYLTDLMQRMTFSDRSIELEHAVAIIVKKQVDTGWWIDQPALFRLLATLERKLRLLEEDLQATFPPKITVLKTKVKSEPFNPGSRKQIAEALMARGWKPSEYTEKGAVVVDEEVLSSLDYPEAKLLAEYFMVQKRLGMVESWVKALDEKTGRIYGRVISNGAVTGRMTHSNPNLAQVPAAKPKVPYGVECRSCFSAEPPNVLVGVDASGLELRMLAHYMNDPAYIEEVVNGDVHTKNQKAAGLDTRDQAKTFIYALLYGAGAEKIGSIAGGGEALGSRLMRRFFDNTPALAELKSKVARIAAKGTIPGLDGRRLHIRQPHKALNTLLQGGGAILMKQALIFLDEGLTEAGLRGRIVGNIHDEFQIEAHRDDADAIGQLAVRCIEKAGIHLGVRCPMTGEYRVGRNWSETH